MSRYSPPAFACRLFQTVLPVPYRGALLGDLIEEYALRAESGFAIRRYALVLGPDQAFHPVHCRIVIANGRLAY